MLTRLLGQTVEWTDLDSWLIAWGVEPKMRRTARASSFSASLELVREGLMEFRQERAFAPLYMRALAVSARAPRRRGRSVRLRNAAGSMMGAVTQLFDDPAQRRFQQDDVRVVEALVFAAAEPVEEAVLAARLPDGCDVAGVMSELQRLYAGRGVNLVRAAGRWMFRTAPDLAWLLAREDQEKRKLSRAAIETLAIVAYHQPVTRADIEDIRGVAVSKGALDVLMEAGWVRMRGRRKAPGRPITYGTTPAFLVHFGLDTIGDLPGLDELQGAGLFEGRLPAGFGVPQPDDADALRPDEEPLEPAPLERAWGPVGESDES